MPSFIFEHLTYMDSRLRVRIFRPAVFTSIKLEKQSACPANIRSLIIDAEETNKCLKKKKRK